MLSVLTNVLVIRVIHSMSMDALATVIFVYSRLACHTLFARRNVGPKTIFEKNDGLIGCFLNLNPDVDECSVNNGGCEQNCVNTIGSFRCSCRLGFRLDSTTQNCTGRIM